MQVTLTPSVKARLRAAAVELSVGGSRVSEAALVRDCLTAALAGVIEAHRMVRRAVEQLESERVA